MRSTSERKASESRLGTRLRLCASPMRAAGPDANRSKNIFRVEARADTHLAAVFGTRATSSSGSLTARRSDSLGMLGKAKDCDRDEFARIRDTWTGLRLDSTVANRDKTLRIAATWVGFERKADSPSC